MVTVLDDISVFRNPKGIKFSSELVKYASEAEKFDKATRASKKEEINVKLLELKNEFLTKKAELREIIKNDIAELDAQYKKELEEISLQAQESFKNAEQKFTALGENATEADEKELKNAIKGAKFVEKRSKIKARETHEMRVKDEKMFIEDLYVDYGILVKAMKGRNLTVGIELAKNWEVFRSTFSIKKFLSNKQMWINSIPFFMLMILIIAYAIAKAVTGYKGDLTQVINNGVFIAIVATGAVFIYSSGSFDMSLGPASLMCATVAGMLWNFTHNIFVSFICAILLGAVLGIINAILANVLNLPVMVMTLTMMNILNATHSLMLQAVGNQLYIDAGMVQESMTGGVPTATIVYATFLVGFFLLLWAIFNYTKIGRRNKFVGSNQVAAKYNGISLMKAGIISFAISGIGLGLCGFLFAVSKSGSSYSTGTILDTIGLNVVIAIVFGGMTTSGGPRSRVSCAVIGGFFCIFLDELFRAIGLADWRFLAKGIIFLTVSFFNMYNGRTKMLAR